MTIASGVEESAFARKPSQQRGGWGKGPAARRGAGAPRRRTLGVLSALIMVAALVFEGGLAAAPASALSYPSAPTGVTLTGTTATSISVTANRSSYASGYRLYASTTQSSVYIANLSRAHRSALSSTPKVTLSGLSYSTSTWYYRLAAVNSAGTRYSAILRANLRPAIPTGPKVSSSVTGTSLTWSSGPALGYRIAQATDPTMANGRVNYDVNSRARQFTPYGLRRGTRYYFRVSAVNGASRSGYSTTASAVAMPEEQAVRVLTYNVLASNTAGQIEGDGPLATWQQRRAGVTRLIRAAGADVVAVQEGNGWVGSPEGYGGRRQVDDMAEMLGDPTTGSAYGLATTEVPPTQHGYLRTGRYILYRKSTYALSGAGGHWEIGTTTARRWAAYQVLENRITGARFLFVSVHLSYLSGADGDAQRQAESKSLISQASAYAADQKVPVVYAGDFNSHEGSNHAFDGPGIAFRDVHATDAFEVAQTRTNARYNSANQNRRRPPADGRSIDHVYAPPGVALRSWRLWLELTDGAFTGTIPSDHNPLSVEVTLPLIRSSVA